MIYYHITDTGKLMVDEYKTEMAAAALQQSQSEDDPNAKTSFTCSDGCSPTWKKAKSIYTQNCAACHGQKGEGTVGPNLTDEFWLHGGDVNEIYKTVKFGVPAKAWWPGRGSSARPDPAGELLHPDSARHKARQRQRAAGRESRHEIALSL